MRDLLSSGIVVRSVTEFGMVVDIGCFPFPDAARNELRFDPSTPVAPTAPSPPVSPAAVR